MTKNIRHRLVTALRASVSIAFYDQNFYSLGPILLYHPLSLGAEIHWEIALSDHLDEG